MAQQVITIKNAVEKLLNDFSKVYTKQHCQNISKLPSNFTVSVFSIITRARFPISMTLLIFIICIYQQLYHQILIGNRVITAIML